MTSRDVLRIARLAAEIRQTLNEMEKIHTEAAELLAKAGETEPDHLIVRAAGSILHDFYLAAEEIFIAVAEDLDGGLPAGTHWHRDLLRNVTLELPGIRPPVISTELAADLDEYLRFRHLFRHHYGFKLQWKRMRPLLETMGVLLDRFRKEVSTFCEFLDAVVAHLGSKQ